jgi:hypothetical protein
MFVNVDRWSDKRAADSFASVKASLLARARPSPLPSPRRRGEEVMSLWLMVGGGLLLGRCFIFLGLFIHSFIVAELKMEIRE